MNSAHEKLWADIQNHTLGYTDAALDFTRRLAADNGWKHAYAQRVALEYKRFVFLAATLSHPVTPSDQVDQAWHLHLTYTRDYWDAFCAQVIGRALHHDPTRGGTQERGKFHLWYARTLDAYRAEFGEPPRDIWPDPQQRFAQRFERREIRPWRRPRLIPTAATLLTAGVAGTAWATSAEEDNSSVVVTVAIMIVAVIVIWGLHRAFRSRKGNNSGGGGCGGGIGGSGGSGDSGDGGGGCGGGCGG